MKNKKFLFVLLCGILLFTLTGCGSKKAISISDFKSAVEEAGLSIYDAGEAEADDELVEEEARAYSKDLSIVGLFGTFKSKSGAQDYFESSTNELKTSSRTTVSMGNYDTFEGKLNHDKEYEGYDYIYMARVDDTLLLFVSTKDKKEEVKEIVKKLGY